MARRAALVCLAALAGCQSYSFNPVGKCVIQPGSAQVKLDQVATADLLFVVDDSGSMASNQSNLAQNFGAFIDELAKTQRDRAQRGLVPLDFHIAITTSSVYENLPAQGGATCASTAGSPLTCTFRTYVDSSLKSYACTEPAQTPPQACGDLVTQFWGFTSSHSGCTPGPIGEGRPYPGGDFIAAAGNPRVLHFTKDLGWATWGTASPDPRITDLVAKFQQNISVGTCGSGQEQHLQGGRLAIDKALHRNGLSQPSDVGAGEFPHDGAKLVVVYVGDEDDCSGPTDPNLAVITNGAYDTQDTCVQDWRQPDPAKRKEFPLTDFADHLLGLNRPVAAGFIFSSVCTVGADGKQSCSPGLCGCPTGQTDPSVCHGKSSGTRMKELATLLEQRSVPVVEASVCDASFATTLQSLAELVKPPTGLRLPSQPAAGEVTVLRIVSADGKGSRLCKGPGADQDWWFVSCSDTSPTPAPVASATSCIAIRSGSSCEANPGETYSAEYLGVVPPGGCGVAAEQSSECAQALGGRAQDWTCEIPTGQARGTCLCTGAP